MVHNNATTSSAIPFMEELYSIDTAIRSFSCVPAYEYINKNEYVIPFGAVLAYFFFLGTCGMHTSTCGLPTLRRHAEACRYTVPCEEAQRDPRSIGSVEPRREPARPYDRFIPEQMWNL